MMIRKRSKDQIGRSGQTDPAKLKKIKDEIFRTYNILKEEGCSVSLRSIRKMMPFWVDERLATELRWELIVEGKLPQHKQANQMKAAIAARKNLQDFFVTDLDKRKEAVKREAFKAMGLVKEDDSEPHGKAHTFVTRDSVKSYNAAWRSIRASLAHRDPGLAPDATEHAPEMPLAVARPPQTPRPRYGYGLCNPVQYSPRKPA